MPVPQDHTIAIRFTGLLVFCFDKRRKYCQIGALSKDDHELRVKLVTKGPDLESQSEQRLIVSHGLIRQAPNLWLDVEGDPTPQQQTAEPFIVGGRNGLLMEDQDFRQVIDLEGEHFYNHPLKVRRGVLKPILSIAKGLFYTAALSSELYQAIPVAANGAKWKRAAGRNLGRIAEYVGANIYLTHPNQALVLRAGRNGSELLRLRRETGTTYEITVENGDTPQAPAGSDFHYYYDAFELKRSEHRMLLDTYGLPSIGIGLDTCFPITLSKSDSLVVE